MENNIKCLFVETAEKFGHSGEKMWKKLFAFCTSVWPEKKKAKFFLKHLQAHENANAQAW